MTRQAALKNQLSYVRPTIGIPVQPVSVLIFLYGGAFQGVSSLRPLYIRRKSKMPQATNSPGDDAATKSANA